MPPARPPKRWTVSAQFLAALAAPAASSLYRHCCRFVWQSTLSLCGCRCSPLWLPPQCGMTERYLCYQDNPSVCYCSCIQVMNKQVVTRTTGRSLGCISGAWLDPARGTLVSFDLDDRKPGSGPGLGLSSPARAGNIPLSALRQVIQH